jgi:hypothetical protein
MPKNDVIIYCYLRKLAEFYLFTAKEGTLYFHIYGFYSVLELSKSHYRILSFQEFSML